MMDWYSIINRYYVAGYYSNADVKVFVNNEKITSVQYEEITGESYE